MQVSSFPYFHITWECKVTKPGALTLYGGIHSDFADGMHPYDSIPWRRKTTLKLVPFDNWAAYTDETGKQARAGTFGAGCDAHVHARWTNA